MAAICAQSHISWSRRFP